MSDLLGRLQRHARTSIREPSEQDVEIERLRAEVARLQAVLDAARGNIAAEDAYDAALDAEPFDATFHSNALEAVQNTYQVLRNTVRAYDGGVKPCRSCDGSGKEKLVTGETRVGNAVIRQVDSVKCSTCGGDGEVKPPCLGCGGTGKRDRTDIHDIAYFGPECPDCGGSGRGR